MNPETLSKSYNAKILLFGEHLINLGSDALSIPYNKFSGRLISTTNKGKRLKPYFDFLRSSRFEFLDQVQLEKEQNLEFLSNIPEGYGCGSSGAIVAASYSYFQRGNIGDKKILKEHFSNMEAFYHGKSSGTDPLISYLNTPIRFRSNDTMESLPDFALGLEDYSLIIIDSGTPRNGKVHIDWFMSKASHQDFNLLLTSELIPVTQDCINYLLTSRTSKFISAFKRLSEFQFNHMDKMIPPNMKALWQEGFRSSKLHLKICGAGGGGFFIGLMEKGAKVQGLKEFIYHSLD